MSTVTLTKWGNSVGIRIPSAFIKAAHLSLGEELKLKIDENGVLTLTPLKKQQEAWLKQFNAVANESSENTSMDISNHFDKDEWTW